MTESWVPLFHFNALSMDEKWATLPGSASSSQSPAPCTHSDSQTTHSDSWNPQPTAAGLRQNWSPGRPGLFVMWPSVLWPEAFPKGPITPHQQTLGRPMPRVDSGSLPDHFAAGEHQDIFSFNGYSHCCPLMLRLQLKLCSAGRDRSG